MLKKRSLRVFVIYVILLLMIAAITVRANWGGFGRIQFQPETLAGPTLTPTNTVTSTNTATPTSTPSAKVTATATATPVAPSISGRVTYGNVLGPPLPRLVSNVLMTGAGEPPVSALTAPGGTYMLTGFGAGSYTVIPSKTGDINGAITAYDASLIAQYLVELIILSPTQQNVSKVSCGCLSCDWMHPMMVARFAVGLPGTLCTGTWQFAPTARTYPLVVSTLTNEDYNGLLMGDVSGDWLPTGSRPIDIGQSARDRGPERSIVVDLPQQTATLTDKEIVIPVSVEGVARKNVISYEFDLRFDPSVIQPQTEAVDLAGTVSRRHSVVTNGSEPGLLRVVVYGAMPIDKNGVLLNLRFTAVGKSSSASPLVFERFVFNEGDPWVDVADGMIELF